MIANQKKFKGGAILLTAFSIVLIVIFMPVFDGQNGLSYLDSLYNSISKGSAYYIPKLREEVQAFSGRTITVTLGLAGERQAKETAPLFVAGGARVEITGAVLKITGDLEDIIGNCLTDADDMFGNNGEKVAQKYGLNERRVLYNWWAALTAMDKDLTKQKKFSETKFITTVQKKAVECAYNYYKIEPQNISDKYGLVIFSLFFYVAYTLWYGFAIMNLFEGMGLRLEH